MKPKFTRVIVFSLLALFALAAIAKADIAPPVIRVNVTYNGNPVNGTFQAFVLSCINASDANSIGISAAQLNRSEYDPAMNCYWVYSNTTDGGMCGDGMCSFNYFPPYHFKMVFYLPSLNKSFTTDEINRSNFSTGYAAQLHPNGTATFIAVNNYTPIIPIYQNVVALFAAALVLTLAIELVVSFIYLSAIKVRKKGRPLVTAGLANLISLPIIWFLFVPILRAGLGVLFGEIFAVVFEGLFIYYFNRKTITLKNALLMSLLMNIASAAIGGILLFSIP